MYDFKTLSYADFEDLTRDLVGEALSLNFEGFCPGPDGGIDGRHAMGGQTTILQAKHYAGSSFSQLKSEMRRARATIDCLIADRYLLVTSCPLTPANKIELAEIIGTKLKQSADILGPEDLNAMLRRYPSIEKSHIKLWLSSAAVLDRIIRSVHYDFAAQSREEMEEKVKVYVPNPSFNESFDKLEKHHVLIISGPPGVGKSTLAEMLSYSYIGKDWEYIPIRSLDDGFSALNDSRHRVYYFDDFLGQIALDPKTLAAKDSELARFIRKIRSTGNARFIMTTRAYIFEEARRLSDHLADPQLDMNKYILDVGIYTRRIRARILYNHLLARSTPLSFVQALILSGELPSIIDHPNYNPRVIEWMTDVNRLQNVAPDEYVGTFMGALDNPHNLWDTAFRTHLKPHCQHLLIALFFMQQYGADLDDLRIAYDALHAVLCEKHRLSSTPKDFVESIRILEGGFIALTGRSASFVNPSLRDYLSDYLSDFALLRTIAPTAQSARWARNLWRHAQAIDLGDGQHRQLVLSLVPVAESFRSIPLFRQSHQDPNSLETRDLQNAERIRVILEWWLVTGEKSLAASALAYAENPAEPFRSWRDLEDMTNIFLDLSEAEYDSLPDRKKLLAVLEKTLIRFLQEGLSGEELTQMAAAVDAADGLLSDHAKLDVADGIRYQIEHTSSMSYQTESLSELDDYGRALKRLARHSNISMTELSHALSLLDDRRDEIELTIHQIPSPSVSRVAGAEPEIFSDVDLSNLFSPLLFRQHDQ
ncbi:hypothetical protein [Lysobacter gummosus]|uniref:AAA+ ATPase domain-containing protein n=1 Tax=Lysobacter gummosus TaxID=262324 RepID=A0ABY3XBG0_9GAMM|nr:hypothetical protein [Lysobacter gummosus]UNP28092.1 hypothetical protein MOV92_16510 [Lysobacter gummosus]